MQGSQFFSQILGLIPWNHFDELVLRHKGNKAVKGHDCREVFTTMLFAYISGADSLREISQGMSSQARNLNHWGIYRRAKGAVKLHTVLDHDSLMPRFVALSKGNMHDVKALKELVLPQFKIPEGSIVTMDRGYIDYGLFGQFCRQKISFVTRLKDNSAYRVIEENLRSKSDTILGDTKIELTGVKGQDCPFIMRRVVVYDPKTKKTLDLLTNNFKLAASTIGLIYKARWQIELFFKQLKQSLKIKTFVGTSENAVKVQIYSALCALVLLRHLKNLSDSKKREDKRKSFSFSNMVMLVRLNMFQYISMIDWLKNPFVVPKFVFSDPNQQSLFGQHKSKGRVF